MLRREFVKNTVRLAALAAVAGRFKAWGAEQKRILVLGGTYFLGPALVEALVADGYLVTIFNRGVTNPELFPHVERLHGFRSTNASDQDFSSLASRHFDVIVDVWPHEPDMVASAARLLKERTDHYLYVSSVGAYDHSQFSKPEAISEEAALVAWNMPARAYNRNKAESERRLHEILGYRLTIVRPTGIKGHRDDTPDLLTWLLRLQSGGEHIAPGDGRDAHQMVDVKDVARFLALAIRKSLFGTFNLTGRPRTFREFLEACIAATKSDATLTWIPKEFLHKHGLESDAAMHTLAGNFPDWQPEPE